MKVGKLKQVEETGYKRWQTSKMDTKVLQIILGTP